MGTHLGSCWRLLICVPLNWFSSCLDFSYLIPWLLHLEVNGVGKLQEKKKTPCCLWTYPVSGAMLYQSSLLAGWAAQQGSVQSTSAASASGGNGGRLEGRKKAAVRMFLPFSIISALSVNRIYLDPDGSGLLNCGRWFHIGWHDWLWGVAHKCQLCNDPNLTHTHNEREVCLAVPVLQSLVAALVLNTQLMCFLSKKHHCLDCRLFYVMNSSVFNCTYRIFCFYTKQMVQL